MPEYINPNSYSVHLVGPNNEQIRVKAGQRVILDEYYDKYRTRGYLRRINEVKAAKQAQTQTTPRSAKQVPSRQIRSKLQLTKPKQTQQTLPKPAVPVGQSKLTTDVSKAKKIVKVRQNQNQPPRPVSESRIVGKKINADANEILRANLDRSTIPISNNIGVGILSYNRHDCLKRLVDSIASNTNLHKTTVFISDDGSSDVKLRQYLYHLRQQGGFVILDNDKRLGVAGNHNRLIRCLSRFKYGLMLNDDVEVLQPGWEYFYVDAINKTGFHHFMYRQSGVYGADRGSPRIVNNTNLLVVQERPHGAVLAFDRDMLSTCGYFDESFGLYGMEHVDWSQRAWELGLQEAGFWDVAGSDEYFRLHPDSSIVENKSEHLRNARGVFQRRTAARCGPTDASKLPEVTYIVPFRNIGREDCIRTVVNNVRAQQYPVVHIMLVEQDNNTKIDIEQMKPIYYYLVPNNKTDLFNKSRAFNHGASQAICDILVLHDADMLVQGDYTSNIASTLAEYEGCHMGKTVLYADQHSTTAICGTGTVDKNINCDRIVGYFEGGSLACHRSAFWRVGGFCEDFWGYGCFAPGNLVATQRGYINIESVLVSDRLLTHAGVYQKQIQRIREYSGIVLDIFIPGRLPIRGVTPEHPFLVQACDGAYSWVKANELRLGDVLGQTDIFPDLSPSVQFTDLASGDRSQNKFDINDNQNNLAYLMGMYLAEGVIQHPQKLRTTYFFLHEGEEFLAKHIADIIYNLNPDISVNYDYIKNTCRHVVVSNSFLAKFIFANAGKHKAKNKILSTAYLNGLTDEAVGYLLGGIVDGDGGHQFNSEKRIVYHSSSYNLAFIISAAMRRLGIAHSFGRRKGGSFKNSQQWSYDLTVNREFEHLITSVYPKPDFVGSNSCGHSSFGQIFKIDIRHYDGLIYNFEVENDKSYCVQGIYSHNCEDCDFYARLASGCKWVENRKFDFLHLWHDRVSHWNAHHKQNKERESKLSKLSLPDRIELQRQRLAEMGWQEELQKWT